MNIQAFCEDLCDECNQRRKGVRFSHRFSRAFLCWEHFRLAGAALREAEPTVIRETVVRRCCCHCEPRYGRTETWCHSGGSEGVTRTYSEGESPGRSVTRGRSIGWSQSDGSSS